MDDHQTSDSLLVERVDERRRGFVRKLVLGTAFVAPLASSFSMDALTNVANAQAYGGNQIR